MIKRLYVHQKTLRDELVDVFLDMHEQARLLQRDADTCVFEINTVREGVLDYKDIHALIKSDFEDDIRLLCASASAENLVPREFLLKRLASVAPKHYDFERFLHRSMLDDPALRHRLKKRMLELIGQMSVNTLLEIIEADMNVSAASKRAHIHRNTLHYRLDQIKEKTGIDGRTFVGLSVMAVLFFD